MKVLSLDLLESEEIDPLLWLGELLVGGVYRSVVSRVLELLRQVGEAVPLALPSGRGRQVGAGGGGRVYPRVLRHGVLSPGAGLPSLLDPLLRT